MSQYCDVSDVETYYMGKSFKCEDYVSNADIESFILSESAYIDSILTIRYSLPVTDQDDLMLLKMICEKLVVGTIDDITREKDTDGRFVRGRDTRKEAKNLIDMIIKNQLRLNSTEKTSPIKFNNLDSNGDEVEKRFKDSNIEPTVTTLDRERRRFVS